VGAIDCKVGPIMVLANLLMHLFTVCTNGVVPTMKLVMAIQAANKKGSVCCAADPNWWAHGAGGQIRMVASKVRTFCTDTVSMRICLAKAYFRVWGCRV